MITKIKHIKNLAVFKDFSWDTSVRDKAGNNVILLKKLNVLYGRNYTGKTTLSRILRAMETGSISDKYENPECCVCLTEGDDVIQTDFTGHDKTIRVFNEDFIEDNLKFIKNPNENIEPFAILGEGNNEIETEIETLKTTLGSNEEDSESGLYRDLKSLKKVYDLAVKAHSDSVNALNSQLSNKATGNPGGIKYQSRFGEINYDIRRLKNDIVTVKQSAYKPLIGNLVNEAEKILKEETKEDILELPTLNLTFIDLHEKADELVKREIGQSNKIEKLVKDSILNRWVKEGRQLHLGKTDVCAFCENEISENRWAELDRHFDEESNQLEKDIKTQLGLINTHKEQLIDFNHLKKDQLYSKFHMEFEEAETQFNTAKASYIKSLESLEEQLKERNKDIINKKDFFSVDDFTYNLNETFESIKAIRVKSNEYTDKLSIEQDKAKEELRLKEVYDFINDIKYDDIATSIATLKEREKEEQTNFNAKLAEIRDIIEQIDSKQKQLKDESKGAEKVNEYLNDHFGHAYLSLVPIEFEDEDTGNKIFRFEIHREGNKAYHLSEGEKSLIAFCYFVAKLEDVDTKSKKPIIWIDDPISSLDNNHIFFIYSLINAKICLEDDFEQLFISTHNLNFLKYLHRLKVNGSERQFLIVERNDKESTILEMPKYIQKNVTEFNHLFKQIFECARIDNITDENYTMFYNFGNNTRKFLEIFLFYKYPDSTSHEEKMKNFFGMENVPAVLTDRINNEYSHMAGVFERGQQPVEVPEIKKTAELIIEKIKEHDENQYNAFLNSIGYEQQE